MVDTDGRRLNLTHLDTVFWPEEGYTKQDLLEALAQGEHFLRPRP